MTMHTIAAKSRTAPITPALRKRIVPHDNILSTDYSRTGKLAQRLKDLNSWANRGYEAPPHPRLHPRRQRDLRRRPREGSRRPALTLGEPISVDRPRRRAEGVEPDGVAGLVPFRRGRRPLDRRRRASSVPDIDAQVLDRGHPRIERYPRQRHRDRVRGPVAVLRNDEAVAQMPPAAGAVLRCVVGVRRLAVRRPVLRRRRQRASQRTPSVPLPGRPTPVGPAPRSGTSNRTTPYRPGRIGSAAAPHRATRTRTTHRSARCGTSTSP